MLSSLHEFNRPAQVMGQQACQEQAGDEEEKPSYSVLGIEAGRQDRKRTHQTRPTQRTSPESEICPPRGSCQGRWPDPLKEDQDGYPDKRRQQPPDECCKKGWQNAA